MREEGKREEGRKHEREGEGGRDLKREGGSMIEREGGREGT